MDARSRDARTQLVEWMIAVMGTGGNLAPAPRVEWKARLRMNRYFDATAATTPGSEKAFQERVRRALSHDVHTPLGTIANYASILEYHGEPKPAEVPVFAARIRTSALRAAAMLQTVAEAIALSQRPLQCEEIEASGVLRAILAELALHAHFPTHGPDSAERSTFDRELLTFAWKAFLISNAEASGGRVLDIDADVETTASEVAAMLWVGGLQTPLINVFDAEHFPSSAAALGQPDSKFALGFVEDLVALHGGTTGFFGRAGDASGLRITFPRSH
jgi:signal transduction histidine kinase